MLFGVFSLWSSVGLFEGLGGLMPKDVELLGVPERETSFDGFGRVLGVLLPLAREAPQDELG